MDQKDVTAPLFDDLTPEEEQEEDASYVKDTTVLDGFAEAERAVTGMHGYRTDRDREELYLEMYEEVARMLEGVEYDADDVEEFVLANVNRGRSEVLGLYTGVLAQLLTEREDGTTRIHVDGRGNRFDYMFSMAKELDEVYVQNFAGDEILFGAGGRFGEADCLAMHNLEGDGIGGWIGFAGGDIGTVVFNEVEGRNTGEAMGKSLYARQPAGLPIKLPGGRIDTVIFDGVSGDTPGNRTGYRDGTIELTLLRDFPLDGISEQPGEGTLALDDLEELALVDCLPRRLRERFEEIDYSDREEVEETVHAVKDYLEKEGRLRGGLRKGKRTLKMMGATARRMYDDWR